MPAPPPSPSHFDRLPTELLKHIVLMVAVQDKRFRKGGIARSASLPTSRRVRYHGESDDENEEVRADAETVSWWYGRGVDALSIQNKRLRELCLPLLCPVVKPSFFSKPIFRFGRIPQAMLDGIKRLDLRETGDTDFLAAAERLPQLANLSQLEVPAVLPISPDYEQHYGFTADLRAARQLAQEAFEANRPRIKVLIIRGYNQRVTPIAAWLSIFSHPESLVRLKGIDCGTAMYHWTVRPAEGLAQIARKFTGLTSLNLIDSSSAEITWFADIDDWLPELQFPALRTFKVSARSIKVFDFVRKAMPQLTGLAIYTAHDVELGDIQADATFTLPDLKYLDLVGPMQTLRILPHLQLPQVGMVCFLGTSSTDAVVDLAETIPPGTYLPKDAELCLILPLHFATKNGDKLQEWCDKNNISLELERPQHIELLLGNTPRARVSKPPAALLDSIRASVDWTTRHSEQLLQFGDEAGLREILHFLKPLRQKERIQDM
ncbi:Proteophosphoglycan ppg4 [Rhodotorula toruloides]|nr:Proteophosphoglycan ppg4 [Rhodotorula toruloides]